jgi:hypothetical protein
VDVPTANTATETSDMFFDRVCAYCTASRPVLAAKDDSCAVVRLSRVDTLRLRRSNQSWSGSHGEALRSDADGVLGRHAEPGRDAVG